MDHHRRPGDRPPATPPAPSRPTPARSTPAAETAADVCRRYRSSDAAKASLRDDLAPDAFASTLVDRGLAADAVEFQARRLPAREAVWWGSLCAWVNARPGPAGVEDEAFRAAVRWVIDPSEANRLAAGKAGEAAGLATPAGALALAASWSGGSMTAPDLPVAAPPADLAARTVVAALRLASARNPGASLANYARMAAEVAAGSLPWTR